MEANKSSDIRRSAIDAVTEADEKAWMLLWMGKNEYIADGSWTLSNMDEVGDVRITGKAEFLFYDYDPGNDEETNVTESIEFSLRTLPFEITHENAKLTVKREGNKIVWLSEQYQVSNKGYVTFSTPVKLTITSVEQFTSREKEDVAGLIGVIYSDEPDDQDRVMDIYYPSAIVNGSAQSAKVIMTIHGGNWTYHDDNERHYYDYMAPNITGNGLIHVNIEYRRLANDGSASGRFANDYKDMLDDITAAIKFLYDNSMTYHIDKSALGLMGYSAGGHLALMHAYTENNDPDVQTIPVKLVISEAGPLEFWPLFYDSDQVPVGPDPMQGYVCALLGHDLSEGYPSMAELAEIEPFGVIDANDDHGVYALLVYGEVDDGNGGSLGGDGVVPYPGEEYTNRKFGVNEHSLVKVELGHNEMQNAYEEAESDYVYAFSKL